MESSLLFTESFDSVKSQILKNLEECIDYSPKGSIDSPVYDLVMLLNRHPHLVTTSSCSGRVCVSFPNHANVSQDQIQMEQHNNNSKGVSWALVRHGFVRSEEVKQAVEGWTKESSSVSSSSLSPITDSSVVAVLKCEPFILHLCCRSAEQAKRLHTLALDCGYRESGITLGNKRVMIAIRTTAFSLEVPLAVRGGEKKISFLYDDSSLDILINEVNSRMRQNFARIDRFLNAFKNNIGWPSYFYRSLPSKKSIENLEEKEVENLTDVSSVKRYGHNNLNIEVKHIYHLYSFGKDEEIIQEVNEKKEFVSLVFGGQGLNSTDFSNKETVRSSRKIDSCIISRKIKGLDETNSKEVKFLNKIKKFPLSVNSIENSVHSKSLFLNFQEKNLPSLMIISGGRNSLTKLLPFFQLYEINSIHHYDYEKIKKKRKDFVPENKKNYHQDLLLKIKTAEEKNGENEISSSQYYVKHSGDYPSPRWGHSIHRVNEYKLVVFGGRNETDIFNDLYVADIRFDSTYSIEFNWKKINLEKIKFEDKSLEILTFNRFFHASTVIPRGVEGDDDDFILIHGGLSDLTESSPLSSFLLFDPSFLSVKEVHLASNDKQVVETFRFSHTLNVLLGKSILLIGGSSLTGESSSSLLINYNYNNDGTITFITHSADDLDHKLNCLNCRGHHTVSFNNNTLELIISGGGALSLAFGDHLCSSHRIFLNLGLNKHLIEDKEEGKRNEKEIIKVVKQKDSNNYKKFDLNKAPVNNLEKKAILIKKTRVKLLKNYLEKYNLISKILKIFSINKKLLKFSSCSLYSLYSKTHINMIDDSLFNEEIFMAIPIEDQESLQKLTEVQLQELKEIIDGSNLIIVDVQTVNNDISEDMKNNKSDSKSISEDKKVFENKQESKEEIDVKDVSSTQSDSIYCILIEKSKAKLIKNYLESKKLISKKLKIFSTDAGKINYLIENKLLISYKIEENCVKQELIKDITDNYLSIPLQDNEIIKNDQSLISLLNETNQESIIIFSTNDLNNLLKDNFTVEKFNPNHNLNKLNQILSNILIENKLYDQLSNEIPKKFEYVGDILMVPETCLINSFFESIYFLKSSQSYEYILNLNGEIVNDEIYYNIWSFLADLFSVQRIARKALIDPGPMRRSLVRLLYNSSPFQYYENDRDEFFSLYHKDIELFRPKVHEILDNLPVIFNEKNDSSDSNKCDCKCNHTNIPGWVTVLENKISFSFDITQVMFCSGNNTERIRYSSFIPINQMIANMINSFKNSSNSISKETNMKNFKEKLPISSSYYHCKLSNNDIDLLEKYLQKFNDIKAEVIVDLYSGIGYYTLPLIINYPHIEHLYACEWNPYSIYFLRHNIIVNLKKKYKQLIQKKQKIDIPTYSILLGDNRITTNPSNFNNYSTEKITNIFTPQPPVHKLYNDIDRISLGLLPSSKQGWPIASRMLNKERGGILHVHENVHEDEFSSWLVKSVEEFEELLNLKVFIYHVEIVKSYAPRVNHYVVDLICVPSL